MPKNHSKNKPNKNNKNPDALRQKIRKENASYDIPFDAKFDADFKNVQFYVNILSSSQVIGKKRPFFTLSGSGLEKRVFLARFWPITSELLNIYI